MKPDAAVRNTARQNGSQTSSPHQRHKAHASADVPHLDGFVSGAREQEGAWFTALLALNETGRENISGFNTFKIINYC